MLAIVNAFGTGNPLCTDSCRLTATHPWQSSAWPSKLRTLELRTAQAPHNNIAALERAFNILACSELRASYDALWTIPRPPQTSRTVDLVRYSLLAISHPTDRRFSPRASCPFSQNKRSNTSERHCERSPSTTTTQSTEIRAENRKYSSTKHCYRCCGIPVGINGKSCWGLRSASKRPSSRTASINTARAHGIWRSGRQHFRASKSHCPQTLMNRSPKLARPTTAPVSLPKCLI